MLFYTWLRTLTKKLALSLKARRKKDKHEARRPWVEHLEDRLNPAPGLLTSFNAINFDQQATLAGFFNIPPDPHGAVGPTHLVNVVNTAIQFWDKNNLAAPTFQTRLGRNASNATGSFFAAQNPVNGTFDPKVVYDTFNNRFVVVALEQQDTANGDPVNSSRILIAVSDDSDPNGSWFTMAINSNLTIAGQSSWADYPGLAVDDKAIYITANMFSFASGASTGSRLWIVNKNPLYSGGAGTFTLHDPSTLSGQPGQSFTLQPAQMYGTPPGSTGTFLVSTSWTSGVNEVMGIIRVDNPVTSPTFSNQFITLGNISTGAPPDAPQSGTGTLIATNDTRAINAVWRNNNLYVANTVTPVSGADAGQATAHWYRFNTTNLAALTLADQGNAGGNDVSANAFTWFPSVAVDAANNVGMGFSGSSAGLFAGAYYTGRLASDTAGSMQATGTLQAGTDFYIRTFGGSENRWGDYTATVVDPEGYSFWVFNEYAMTRGTVFGGEDGRWATRWGQFAFGTTAVEIDGSGNLVVRDVVDRTTNDNLRIRSDTANSRYEITDLSGNIILTGITGSSGSGTSTVLVPFAAVTGSQIIFDTLAGNDTLTVDYSLGNFSKSIQFLGGQPTTGPGDTLVLQSGGTGAGTAGNPFAGITHDFTNNSDGSVNVAGQIITYTGLEPITDNLVANNRTFNFNNAGVDAITLNSSGANRVIDSAAFGESVTFVQPNTTLTINSGSNDSLAVNATLSTTTTISLTSGSIALAASLTSATVQLTASGSTITESVAGPAILGNGTLIASAVSGIALDTTVANITATTSGTGDITINETDGATVQNVSATTGNATLTNASGDLTIVKVAASGTVQLTATLGALLDGDGATVDNVVAGTFNFTTANGVGTAADPLEISVGTIAAGNKTAATGGVFLTEANGLIVNSLTTANGAVTITVLLGNLTLGTGNINAGTGGTITLTVSAGAILDDTSDTNADLITTGTATLSASTGVGQVGTNILDVDVGTLSVTTATGGISINLLDPNNSGTTITNASATTSGTIEFASPTPGTGTEDFVNVSANSGDILINHGSLFSSVSNAKFNLQNITATNGNITIVSGGTLGSNNSITVQNVTSVAAGKTIEIDAIGILSGATSLTHGSGTISGNGGLILLIADQMTLAAGSSITSGAADVRLRANNPNRGTQIGATAADTTTLGLTDVELNTVTPGANNSIIVGNVGGVYSGTITVVGAANLGTKNLALQTSGAVSDGTAGTGGNLLTLNNLTFSAGTGLDVTTKAALVAGKLTGNGAIQIDEADALTIGSFVAEAGGNTTFAGLTSNNGNITVNTGGTMTISNDVTAGSNGSAFLTATSGDVAINANIRSSTAGNGTGSLNIVANNGNLTTNGSGLVQATGANGTALLRALTAGTSIGTLANPIRTDVDRVSASGLGANVSIFLTEAGSANLFNSGGPALSAGTGTVTLVGGTYIVVALDQVNDNTNLVVNAPAVFNVNAQNEQIGSLAGSGTVDLGNGGTLTTGNANNTTFSGSIISSGASLLVKQGTGIFTLSGNNTFTGSLSINGGILEMAATGKVAANVRVNSGGTLAGTGTITGQVTNQNAGGLVAPGAAAGGIGTLNTGTLGFPNAATFLMDVNGKNAGQFDQLNVNGDVDLTNVTLSLLGGYAANPGDTIMLINNTGGKAVAGTFVGLAEGSTVTVGGFTGKISYVGGDGNDVTIKAITTVFDTSVALDGSGNLVITDINSPTDDNLKLSIVGIKYRIEDLSGNLLTTSIAGATGDGTSVVLVDISAVTGTKILINTLAGNDKLTIDFSGGNFGHAITYDGGTQTTSDTLTLSGGGTFASVGHGFTDDNSGTISITGNSLISYLGLEPITDNLSATDRSFTFSNAGADAITLGASGGNRVIDSNFGESVTFAQPSGSLTITSGTNDSFTLNSGGALTVPTISLTSGSITLNDTLAAGVHTLTATGSTITESVAGAAVLGGALNASAVSGITLDTTVIDITATVSGTGNIALVETNGANLLNIATAKGTINVTTTTSNLNVTTVTSSTAGNPVSLKATAGSITDANGAAVNVTGSTTTLTAFLGIDLDTDTDSITATSTGTGNIALDEASGALLSNVSTNNGSITLTAGGTFTVGSVTAGNAGTASLTAGGQIIDDANDGTADITGSSVTLVATAGIGGVNGSLDVNADSLPNVQTATGGIAVNLIHTLQVIVTTASATTSGDIVFTADTGGGTNTYVFNSVVAANGNISISKNVQGVFNVGNLSTSATAGRTIFVNTGSTGPTGLDGVDQQAGTSIQTNGGLVTLIGNSLNLQGTTNTTVGGGSADVRLMPFNLARNIEIGAGAVGPGAVDLSDTELNSITTGAASAIVVGDVTVTGTITAVGAANLGSKNLHLVTSNATAASIFDGTVGAGGNLVTAGNLTFQTAGGIDFSTAANLVAAQGGAGLLRLDEADAVTVGSFHGITGLSTTNGGIALRAGGAITVSNDINARSSGSVTVVGNGGSVAINANILSTAGAAGNAGDGSGVVLVQNLGGTLTTNGSGTVKATGAGAAISLIATGDIGTVANPILTDANNLQALIGSGGGINIFLSEANTANFAISNNSLDAGTGTATLVNGTFTATANDVVGNSTNLVVNTPVVFNLNGKSDTIGSLAGTGTMNLGAGGSLSTGTTASTTFSGQITGSGTLVKQGAGTTFTLSGNTNNYSGATNVNAGVLLVTNTAGSATGTSTTSVASGATLAGTGTVGAVSAASGGIVAPGLTSGDTTNTLGVGNTTLAAGSNLNIEIGGTAANAFDQLAVVGTVNVTGATLNLSFVGGYTPTVGDKLTLIDNDLVDGITGTFNGLAEGTILPFGAVGFKLSYAGGTGNDVTLTAVSLLETNVTLDGSGNLLIQDINGGNSDDTLTITATATQYIISDPNRLLTTNIPGATGDVSNTITVNRSSVTGTQIIFDTLGGNDSLTINFATGAAAYGQTIVYNAGTQTTSDTLILNGGTTFATVTHSFTNNNDGSVVVAGSGTVNYTGLEPISDNLSATNRVFTFTNAGAENISFTASGGNRVIDSDIGGESITFALPSSSLTVNAGANDTFNLNASISVTDNVSITGGTLNLNNTITGTAGTSTVSLTSGASIVDGNGGTVNVTANSLTASAVTGIDLDTTVANLTATVSGTGNITIDETDGANLLNIATAKGTINVTTATGNLNVTTVTSSTTGNPVTLTATAGAITDANGAAVNVTASTTTFTAASGIDLDTDTDSITATLSGAGNIAIDETSGAVLVNVSTTNGSITLTAGGTFTIGTVTAGSGSSASLTAGDQILDDVNDAVADITAGTVTLSAVNGIGVPGASTLDIDANTITNAATTSGGIGINLIHTTNVTVNSATATSGNIQFNALTGGGAGVTYQFDNVTAGNGNIAIITFVPGNIAFGNLNTSGTAGRSINVAINNTVGSINHTGGTVQTNGGAIVFVADAMGLTGGTITSGAADVRLRPFTNTRNIQVGATASDAATLGLTDVELNTITTAATNTIVVGDTSQTSTITVVGAANLGTRNLSLETNNATAGAISDGTVGFSGNLITGTNLTFQTAGGMDVSTAATLIAAQGGNGAMVIDEADAVTVGAFHGITGLSNTNGNINLRTGGNLTISNEINARTNGFVTLLSTAGGIAINANVLSTQNNSGNAGDGSGTLNLVGSAGKLTQGGGTLRATNGIVTINSSGDMGTLANPILTDALKLSAATMFANKIDIFLADAFDVTFFGSPALDAGGGTATLVNGLFLLGTNEQIADTTNLVVNAPAAFNANSKNETIGSLAGNGLVSAGAFGQLVFGATQSTTFSGVLTGGSNYTMQGAGNTFTLSGNTNSNNGGTIVNAGTLLLTNTAGSATGASFVRAITSGTLGGTGSFTGLLFVDAGGTLAPGLTSGDTTDDLGSGSVTMVAGGSYNVEISGLAATQFDQLVVTGTVSLGNATLNITHLPGFSPAVGNTLRIIDNDGVDPIVGTFAGLAEGATFTAGGAVYKISYVGGTGNDVEIKVITAGTTSVDLDASGNLVITDIVGGNTDDTLKIARVNVAGVDYYEVSDPNNTLTTTTAGFVQVNANTIQAKIADVTGTQIIFNTLAGDDNVVIDFGGGNYAHTITYNAGANGAKGDSLTLTGGGIFANVAHAFTNNNDGTISITGNGLISYNGLEPITDNLTATTRNFTYNGGAETITITDAGGGRTIIDSNLGESVNFLNATTSDLVDAGTGNDTVSLVSFGGTGLSIDGGAGTNTLQGPNAANTWNITLANAGNVAGVGFSNMQNLTGNTNTDKFVIADAASITGTIDGGGNTDTLDYTAYQSPISVNLQTSTATGTGGFVSIENLVGGAKSDTLTGANVANTWNITGNNAGNVNGTFTFSSIENLTGGTNTDKFIFTDAKGVAGVIDGAGNTDTLDYTAYTTGVSVNLQTPAATGTGGFASIENFLGGAGSDTFTGLNSASNFTFNANNAVNYNGTHTASSFENYVGGTAADQFVFNDGITVSGQVDGTAGIDTLNFNAWTTARSFTLTGPGTTDGFNGTTTPIGGGFANINNIVGSTSALTDTLTGANANATWTIGTASDSYTSGGKTLTFSNFESFNGGSQNDTFNVTPSATITFTINGNAPTLPTLPGDTLNLDLTGVTGGRIDLNGPGLAAFGGTGKAPVNYTNIETVNVSKADVELFVNLNATGAGTFNGGDGNPDTTVFQLDPTGQNLQVLFNGGLAFSINVNAIRALSIQGSTDADTVRLQEVNGRMITEGTGTTIGSGNFGGTATGSHLNSAMSNFVGATNNVQIQFDGGPGAATDSLALGFTTKRNGRYFADTVAANRSGNVNVSGTNGAPISNLRLSFSSLTPVNVFGAGGDWAVDATLLSATLTDLTFQDDATAGDGVSEVVSTDANFETNTFAGFDSISIFSSDKAQTINIKSIDSAATERTINITADETATGGNDTINLMVGNVSGAALALNVFAGDGNDTINVGDTTNSLDPMLGAITINGENGTDVININDQGDVGGNTYTVTSTTVDRTAAGQITYSTAEQLIVNASLGADTVNIQSTLAATPVTVNGGTGDDTFNVGDATNSLDNLLGKLTLNGNASTTADVVNINDQGDAGGNTYTINTTTVDRTGAAQITYGTVEQLIVNGSLGADTVNVQSTLAATPVTVNGGTGDDTFNVGDATNSLKQIAGLVQLNGNGNNDTVNFNDQGDAGPQTYTLTNNTLTRSGAAGVSFVTVEAVNLNASLAGDTINVTSSFATVTTTVNAGTGDDTINVGNAGSLDLLLGKLFLNGNGGAGDIININDQTDTDPNTYTITGTTVDRTAAGQITYGTVEQLIVNAGTNNDTVNVQSTIVATPVTVNGGTGDDTFNVGSASNSLDGLLGKLTLNGDAHGTGDIVNINDQGDGDANAYTINKTTIDRSGAAQITYGTAEQLIVNAGTSDDTVFVQSTLNTTPVTVNGGTGDDTFNVGDATNSMDQIGGTVVLNGNAHTTGDTVKFNDQGDAGPNTYTLTNNTLTRSGAAGISFTTVEVVNLNASLAADTINITSSFATVTTVVNAGTGDDTINVGNAGSLDNLLGALFLNGNGGTGDVININDQADTDPNTYVLTPTTLTRTGTGGITYGTVETLNLTAGSGADTVTVTPSSTTTFNLDGANPTTFPGDTINLNITGVTNGRVDLNGINNSTFTGGGGILPVNYKNFETVNFAGADYELFVNLNSTVAGSFNGPTGFDGAADTTVFQLDAAGQNLQVIFNGTQAYSANVNAIKALNIIGSQDADTVRVQEVNGRLITEGTQAKIGNGNFGGTATNSHLNTGLKAFVGGTPTVPIDFDGGPGAATDTLVMAFTSKRNARYIADTMAANRSGNINVSGTNGAPLSNLRLSFQSLTPVNWIGAGGTWTSDASLIAAAGDTITIQDDGTAGDGVSQVVSTNAAWETENLSGWDEYDVIAGDLGQTIILASLDTADTVRTVQIFADDTSNGTAGDGADTINIQTAKAGVAAVAVVAFGGDGNDLVNIGNTANSLDDHLGTVTVNGEGGTDNLKILDQGDAGPNTYKLTSTTVDRTGAGQITYGTVETLLLNASTGADTVNIQSTLATTPVTVNGGTGDDTFNLSSDAPTNNGDLAGINGTVTIDAQAGANKLVVSDFAAAAGNANVVITATQITGFAGAADATVINYAATGGTFSNITVSGSNAAGLGEKFTVQSPNGPFVLNMNDGADTANVQSLTNVANINGGAGNDTVNLASDAPTNAGNLAGFGADVTVDGGTGTNDLNVSDFSAGAGNANVVITATQITGFAGAADAQLVNYSNVTNLNVIGSDTVGEKFTVQSPSAKLNLSMNGGADTAFVQSLTNLATVSGGTGDDTFNIGNAANSLDNLGANLTVNGDAHGTGDVLNINDQGDTDPNTYNLLAANTMTRNGTFTLTYNTVEFFNLNAGSASDIFNIATAALSTTTKYLFDGNNPPPPASPGDTVNLDITGVANGRVDVNGPGLFNFSGGGLLPPNFVDIETFNVTNGTYDLYVHLDATVAGSFNGPTGFSGNIGSPDITTVRLDAATGTLLQILFKNGVDPTPTPLPGAADIAFQGNVTGVKTLTVIGSQDADTLRIEETKIASLGGAGKLITEMGGFAGDTTATADGDGAHTNPAMTNFFNSLGVPAGQQNMQIHFNGNGPANNVNTVGGSTDTLTMVFVSARNARYFADTLSTIKSGTINVSATPPTPVTAANATRMRISFSSLTPIEFLTSAPGSTMTVDASGITGAAVRNLATTLNVEDDGIAGNGVSRVSSPNNPYFETTYFAGYQTLEVLGGVGNQTLNLAGLDSRTSLKQVTLNGADTLNKDLGNDTLIVTALPASLRVSLLGGKGNDRFQLGQNVSALDAVFINGGLGSDTLQTTSQASAARTRLNQRSLGVESFLNTKPIAQPVAAAPADNYSAPRPVGTEPPTSILPRTPTLGTNWADLLSAL